MLYAATGSDKPYIFFVLSTCLCLLVFTLTASLRVLDDFAKFTILKLFGLFFCSFDTSYYCLQNLNENVKNIFLAQQFYYIKLHLLFYVK